MLKISIYKLTVLLNKIKNVKPIHNIFDNNWRKLKIFWKAVNNFKIN